MVGRSMDLLRALLQFLGTDIYLSVYDYYKPPERIYGKPFFRAYITTGCFIIYLIIVWLLSFYTENKSKPSSDNYEFPLTKASDQRTEDDAYYTQTTPALSDSSFVPIRDYSTDSESDDSGLHAVRFNKSVEVREMSAQEANDALFARLSYNASVRVSRMKTQGKTAKAALVFALLWQLSAYLSNLAYEMADHTLVSVVIAATTPLFVLFLAAIFPSVSSDRLTPMKLVAVALHIYGAAVLISPDVHTEICSRGTLVAVFSAFFAAAYLVYLKRKHNAEFKIDPLFFMGFVAFWVLILMWPILFILHFLKIETFEHLPVNEQVRFIPEYIVGISLPVMLWLITCLSCSTLLSSLTLMQPIALKYAVKWAVGRKHFWEESTEPGALTQIPITLILSGIPMLLAMLIMCLLVVYNDADPLLALLRLVYRKLMSTRRHHLATSDNDIEQQESLISSGSE